MMETGVSKSWRLTKKSPGSKVEKEEEEETWGRVLGMSESSLSKQQTIM